MVFQTSIVRGFCKFLFQDTCEGAGEGVVVSERRAYRGEIICLCGVLRWHRDSNGVSCLVQLV